jgi:hypothetical protein
MWPVNSLFAEKEDGLSLRGGVKALHEMDLTPA